ncbi:hypothetical protein ACFLUU_04995 [Chloroflexota bacterium]
MSRRCQPIDYIRTVKVAGHSSRLLLAIAMIAALLGFYPAPTHAATNPLDLELGPVKELRWSITSIQPADSGTETVELHNVGSKHGFVTIWVSDIISSEGINPESETGNTAEPGELANYLLLDISSNRSSTSLKLPATINNLPQSISDPNSIEIVPLKAGDIVNLQWEWELPAQTGNDAQGDNISFTINYLLTELEITDVSEVVEEETGTFTDNVTVESELSDSTVTIKQGTVGKTKEGEAISELWFLGIDKDTSAPSEDTVSVGNQYDAGPHGSTFDQPITITLAYDPADIPERASEEDLVIATWDEDAGKWIKLEGSTVDTVKRIVSAQVVHFSRYIIIVPVPPPPPPTPTPVEDEETEPPPPPVEELPPPPVSEKDSRPVIANLLETDMLGQEASIEIGADGTLVEPLTLTDRTGNFIIDIDSGTRITGSNNTALSRMELTIAEESIAVPDDIVVLSQVYKLIGYTQNMEVSQINFEPSVRLTISYDPENLPENAFTPFVGRYTDEEGLVRLDPSPGATIEIGKAKAKLSHASLFAVMTQLAPPPPPLPAKFEVSSLTINPIQAQLGQSVVISLTIANEGATAGNYELYLKVDGIIRTIEEITLTANSTEIVSFEVSNLAIGKHEVKIAHLTGQFSIVSTAILPIRPTVNWLTIDLGIGAVVLIGIGLLRLYLFRRRR